MNLPLVIHARSLSASRDVDGAVPMMDEAEFRAFYERSARPLWAYVLRITRDPDRAQDVVQEAYYRFYRAGARHEDEAHRRNSLFQIATNLVRDAARKAKRYQDVPLEEDESLGTVPRSASPIPEREVMARTDLARAMEQIKPVQREMLWLAYAQGATHEEIAEILGLRPASIRTMLFRARKKLAGILSGPAEVDSREART